jgi:hypothetical protein
MHLLHTAQRDDGLEVEPAASSRYRGLMVSMSQRLAEDAVWSVGYTVSRATDDASDYDEVGSEWAPSRFDQRHRLVASARFEIEGRKIELAPILTIGSGLPVDGASRNCARLPSSTSLSLRVLKYVEVKPHGRLDFVAEAFNVLGRKTVEPSKRQIEFSLDLEF